MSSISSVSSYARYLNTTRLLNNAQKNVDSLTTQLTSGTKSGDLSTYGAETQRLLELRTELVQRKAYVDNISKATSRLEATDKTMTALESIASSWLTATTFPYEPGDPSVTGMSNANATGLEFTIDTEKSTFTANAKYTVTAEPAPSPAVNGTYNVTISDGLGGKTTRAVNLNTVPPDDGDGYNFKMTGGPGDGTVLNIDFKALNAASSSTFDVSFPDTSALKSQTEDALRDVQNYLNERYEDRYLYAGSRFDTSPVTDLTAERQVSRVTFNGTNVDDGDYFEVKVGDQVFSLSVSGNTLNFTADNGATSNSVTLGSAAQRTTSNIAGNFATFINQWGKLSPAMTVIANSGALTFTGSDPGVDFDVSGRVLNAATVENSVDDPTTTQAATTALPQIDTIRYNGQGVEAGDTFSYTITVGDPDDPYNLKYYQNNPTEPKDLPAYQAYTVSYTVTADDINSGAVSSVDDVAGKLVTQFNNLSPKPAVTVAQGTAPDANTLTVTSAANLSTDHPGQTTLFTTSASVVNASLDNAVTVTKLPPQSGDVTSTIVDKPGLPFYDAEADTMKSDTRAWTKSSVTADDSLNVEYGVVSTDPAFQTLIAGLRMARAAASNPGKYDEYASEARGLLTKAQSLMRQVHAKVTSDAASLKTASDGHSESINSVTTRVADIEGIDETEVAARLKTAMTTQEAAYTLIGQQQKLSLLNYLS